MTRKKFYDTFHNNSSVQTKLISEKNFTYRIIINELNRYLYLINPKGSILDVGCGVGTICFLLADKGYNITGIDISEKAINSCRKSAESLYLTRDTDFLVCDFPRQIPSGRFDMVIASEILEHVEDDKKVIKTIYSLLKTNGLLYLSVPSKNAPLFKWEYCKEFDKKVGHLRRYVLLEIVNLLKLEGFEILEVKKTEGILRNFLFLNPIAEKLIRFIRGPISDLITIIDNFTVSILGESDLIVVAIRR